MLATNSRLPTAASCADPSDRLWRVLGGIESVAPQIVLTDRSTCRQKPEDSDKLVEKVHIDALELVRGEFERRIELLA